MIEISNIENYTEDIRQGLLSLLFDGDENRHASYSEVAHAFDRANVKALHWQIKQGAETPAMTEPPAPIHGKLNAAAGRKPAASNKKGPGPAAGSDAARQRALLAGETRRRNKAAAEAASAAAGTKLLAPAATAETTSPLQPTPRPTGFGGTSVSPLAHVSGGPAGGDGGGQ